MWPLQTMEADCIDRSICMRLATLHLVALLLALGGRANAQATDGAATDPGQLVSRWQAANTTCRSPAATAMSAVGACEQRDTLSKLLAQMNYCYGVATWAALQWSEGLAGAGPHDRGIPQDGRRLRAASGDQRWHQILFHRRFRRRECADPGGSRRRDETCRHTGRLRFPGPKAIHARRRQRAAAAGVPAEEPADRRPDDGERPGRRRRTEKPARCWAKASCVD